jgi:hypothetical protein
MDKRTLVRDDLVAGRKVVEELERRGIEVDAAAWLRDYEIGTWRLVISVPAVGRLGSRPVYEAIALILSDMRNSDHEIALDDIDIMSPDESLIRDLKTRVGTNNGLHEIRLPRIDIGGHAMSARIYRAAGGTIENGARVRVKATGQLGTVRGVFPTARGPRYLVLYDLTPEQLQPLDLTPRPPVGQDYAAEDLEFIYVVRTGGWPEKLPEVTRPAS